MSWRHLDSAINDPKPPVCSFNMEDVHRLSAHVVKLKDMPEGILVLSWPTQQKLPFYFTPPATIDVVISDPTLEDLAAGNLSAKFDAKAEASQNTTCLNLCAKNSNEENDDDACVEIPLITPTRSAAVIPSDIFGDAIHRDFFHFSPGPYYATYPEGGVGGNREFSREEWDAPH
nr:hypothetical protein [Tanacetum cinerariifolium]